MTKRIDKLTDEQRDRMPPFAQKWIQRGHRTTPLTDEEWKVWEEGAQACYEYAGKRWPRVVVRVPSPIVGAFAAPIAAYAIAKMNGGAVGGAVDGAVGDAVDVAVGDAVGDAVDVAVDGAVDDAVDDAETQKIWNLVARLSTHRFGGIHWAGWWQSYVAYFRDICDLELPGDLWDRSRAYEASQSAGWWWPFEDFVMVCDAPVTLHLEEVGPTGWGSHRLHCEDGPAVAWEDGWGAYSWHGTRVPSDFFTWDVERALSESNSEVRRCAIERIGWDALIDRLTLVAEANDPGNAPHKVGLYDLGDEFADLYSEPARILVVSNASLDKGGHRRRFGLPVPKSHDDPIEAAAALFDVTPEQYASLNRAS